MLTLSDRLRSIYAVIGISPMPPKTNHIHEISINKDFGDAPTFSLIAFSWSSAINETLPNQLLAYSYTFINSNECLSLLNTSVCLSSFLPDSGITYRIVT